MYFYNSGYSDQVVNIPFPLYKSAQGKYFEAYVDNLTYGNGTSAWAALVNPINSGVNFYVSMFAINDLMKPPIDIQIWFNSQLPGNPVPSMNVTPGDTALYPPPKSRVKLLSAINVIGSPSGGVNAFARRSIPGQPVKVDEDGKFVFPPGGTFAIFLTNTEGVETPGIVRATFAWWEENINCY